MTIAQALTWAKKLLKDRGVEGPEASAEFLLRQILKVDRAFIFAHPEADLNTTQEAKYRIWVKRRAKHKPVWYITGKIEFCGLDLAVNQNVLIPRPETELLVEQVLRQAKSEKLNVKSILEIGTGSGAIILSLVAKLHSSNKNFFASDISKKALVVAKKNAKNLGFADKITFKQGDLFSPWKGEKFDFIVANLPYIPHEDISTLAFDLIHYEPRVALDGGIGGLEIYERFFREVSKYLNSGGKVFCEIGYDQGEKIKKILTKIMPQAKITILGDYANIDRIVIIET